MIAEAIVSQAFRASFVVLAQAKPLDFLVMPFFIACGVAGAAITYWYWLQDTRIRRRLYRFFGGPYRHQPVVTRTFATMDIPNVRRAIDAFVAENGAKLEVMTVGHIEGLQSPKLGYAAPQFQQMDIDVDEREDCLVNPLYLIWNENQRWAIRIYSVEMQVMAGTQDEASQCVQALRKLMRIHSVYRGKVITIETQSEGMDDYAQQLANGLTHVKFHRLPPVDGEAIILPPETMKRIHRNTVGFFRNVDRLKQHGFSAKRGLLFHGPPGTGKTRTACWLTHSLPGVTVFLVTGEQLWNIKECCSLARELAPAMLILEDVDLIATRRDQSFQTTALHQLMNEMDGLDSEVEVLFLLTTNQPDQIEPALSNRPGRIDQAIHFALPDEACRKRLIELYRGQITITIDDWPTLLGQTAGSSPAFIKELVRKAAMICVEESNDHDATLTLKDRHFREAFHEMTMGDGALTRRITGFGIHGDSD